jgi:hypothetical protein
MQSIHCGMALFTRRVARSPVIRCTIRVQAMKNERRKRCVARRADGRLTEYVSVSTMHTNQSYVLYTTHAQPTQQLGTNHVVKLLYHPSSHSWDQTARGLQRLISTPQPMTTVLQRALGAWVSSGGKEPICARNFLRR